MNFARSKGICASASLIILISVWPRCQAADGDFENILSPFTAEYRLSRDGLAFGVAKLELQRPDESRYLYQAHSKPTGLLALFREDEILEQSNGRLAGYSLVPDSYSYEHQGSDRQKLTRLQFDWEQGKVTNRTDKSHWTMSIPEGTQDKLILQLAVMLDLARGLDDVAYEVADGGKLKTYRFQVTGRESIKTALGTFDCIRVTRSKQKRPPDYTIWSAPALYYLPVKMVRERKGHTYRMELIALSRLDDRKEITPATNNSQGLGSVTPR